MKNKKRNSDGKKSHLPIVLHQVPFFLHFVRADEHLQAVAVKESRRYVRPERLPDTTLRRRATHERGGITPQQVAHQPAVRGLQK
tara:strand:+ start:455 stop:709 length:255 start_codon:yes stop_codon:yes gene_type:complete